jgi:hypothetical protein
VNNFGESPDFGTMQIKLTWWNESSIRPRVWLGYCYAMGWAGPSQFIDRASWQHECRAALRTEVEAFSRGQDFVPDRAAHYDVHKVVHVLMLGNDTGGSMVILNRQTAPLNSRSVGGGPRLKKWLDPTLADDFDSRDNGTTDPCSRRWVVAFKSWRRREIGHGVVLRKVDSDEIPKICTEPVFRNCSRAPAS